MTLVALVEKATHQSPASLAVTLSTIITYVFYKSWLYPYHLDPLSKIPGPSPSRIPFLGNMLALTKKKPMMALYDWAMEYPGSIYRYYWFSRLTLMTSDPVTVGYVLGKGNDNWLKSKGTEEMFEQNLGHSLLSMKGGEHTAHRKYLAKGFKHTYLKSMATAFHGVAQDLLEVWKERLDDKAEQKEVEVRWEHDGKTYTTIDLEPSFYCLTLDSIGQFALGRGFDAIKSPIGPDFDNYKIIVDSFQVTLLTMLPLSNWIPTKTNRRAWSAVRAFNSSMEGIVQERKQRLIEEIKDHDGEFSQAEGATSQKKDILTMLLVDQLIGEGGTDLQIRHDVFTAIFAGHETTSAALSWTFYQLACHPEVQTRLREETRQLYKDREGAPTYDELNSLPYLNAVIRESLRLWSPIPVSYSALSIVIVGRINCNDQSSIIYHLQFVFFSSIFRYTPSSTCEYQSKTTTSRVITVSHPSTSPREPTSNSLCSSSNVTPRSGALTPCPSTPHAGSPPTRPLLAHLTLHQTVSATSPSTTGNAAVWATRSRRSR